MRRVPEQRTPCAMRPHMKLAQYSHQCGPRKVCTWEDKPHAYTHTHTHRQLQVNDQFTQETSPPLMRWIVITLWCQAILDGTLHQMSAFVYTRQIKGFTTARLASVLSNRIHVGKHRGKPESQNNRCTPMVRTRIRWQMELHWCALEHTFIVTLNR